MFGVLAGMGQTGFFGRKQILFVYSLIMAAILLGLGIQLYANVKSVLNLILICTFVIVF